ncbi:MFS polyamine transporter [Marasmius fiardii PR-910]|nr:MFS polyamine transporter [Marasmius fiardii PR-910]
MTSTTERQEKPAIQASELHSTANKPLKSDLDPIDVAQDSGTPDSKQLHETATSSDHVTIVDWDGPDDPNNPRNWKTSRKWTATLIVSCFTFISPAVSSIISPATAQVAREFHVKSTVLLGMITSVYILGFACGPLAIGPLSEVFGRSRVLQSANIFFLIWNLACGFSQNVQELIVFRFLAGVGGSAPFSIGGAVVGDTFHPEERASAMALYALGPMLGPALGPVAGGWIAEKTSWRWVFWSTSIADALVFVLGLFLLQETYGPILLERKAHQLAKAFSNDFEKGGQHRHDYPSKNGAQRRFRTAYEGSLDRSLHGIVSKALSRPFMLFIREPILQLFGLYLSFIYGTFYIFVTTIPSTFQNVYHQSIGIAGLHFIALGLGLSFGSFFNSRTMDKMYAYFKRRNGDVGEPEFRIPILFPASAFLPLGLLLSGWATQKKLHWFVTDLGTFFIGLSLVMSFQSIQTYIVDVFSLYAASGLAAVFCLRSLFAFTFPLFTPALYKSLGTGWGNTMLAGIAIVVGCPAPYIFWFYGKKVRGRSRYARQS